MPEIPVAELTAMQNRLAELEGANAIARSEAEAARARELIRAGQGDAVLKEHSTRLQEAERRASTYACSTELSKALAGHSLVPGGLEQVHALLADQVVADQTTSGYQVRSRDYRPVADLVKTKLSDPSFAHFLAGNQAAAASHAATAQPGTQAASVVEPRTLGAAILQRHELENQSRIDAGKADGRTNPAQSFGLGKGGSTPSFATLLNHLRGFR